MCRILFTLAAVLFLSGSAMANDEADLEAMLASDREFDAKTAELGVEGWVSYFAEHGSMHLGDGRTIVGHDAIRELMGPFFAGAENSLRWQPVSASIMIPGSLGYTTGHYQNRTRGADGEVLETRGSYVSVWKKQEDGSWKVVFDTGEERK
jgi:ketosteroid isomerase-like protein